MGSISVLLYTVLLVRPVHLRDFTQQTRTMTVSLNLLLLANGPLCVRTNLRARPWSGWGGQPIQLKPGQTFLTETGKPPIWSRDSSPI